MPMFHVFVFPSGFLIISGSIEMKHWGKIG